MSLEAALEKNTATMERLIDALGVAEQGRAAALAAAQTMQGDAGKPATRRKAADKPDAPETPPATAAAASTTIVHPTEDDLKAKLMEHLGVEDEKLRAERKPKVVELLSKHGATKVGEVKPEHRQAVIDGIQALIDAPAPAAADPDDLMG